MEHVDTDDSIRESAFRKGDIAAVHIAAEVLHHLPGREGKGRKISGKAVEISFPEDVENRPYVTIGDVRVEFFDGPAFLFGIPGAGGSFELIDTEGFREHGRNRELHVLHDGPDNGGGNAAVLRDIRDGADGAKAPADPEVEVHCHVE